MRFASPEILWMLFGLPLLGLMLWWSMRKQRAAMERFASNRMLAFLAPGFDSKRRLIKPTLMMMSVAGLVFAAARPQWGYEDRKIISRGVDLMIAIDVSNSMLAQDYRPNRLSRAKDLLQNIIWRAKGDRVGIIAFAGSAFIQCPLTLDYRMAGAALQAVSTNSVSTQGTALGTAINAAVKAFEAGSAGERILVLLTDGENQGGVDVHTATADAQKAKVKVYTIGIGTTQGMPIPTASGYKQDVSGKVVNTRLDFQTLTEIANGTGGKAIKSNPTGSSELDPILADLEKLQKTEQQDQVFRIYKDRYQWFLLPVILLLIIEALSTGASRRSGHRNIRERALA